LWWVIHTPYKSKYQVKLIIPPPKLVTKAPEIDSIILEYKKLPSINPRRFESGVKVYSQWQDPENEENYYMWLSSGTYKIVTHPENHITINLLSGKEVLTQLDCCADCWVREVNSDKSIRIMKDNNSNGNLITNLAVFIEDNGVRYMDKYFITLEQHSISKEAYLFFDLLDNQLNINGNIFAPPPATILGNMISLENPDENVIGYFMATDVAVKSIFIPKKMLGNRQRLKIINDDCRTVLNSTAQQPSFWE